MSELFDAAVSVQRNNEVALRNAIIREQDLLRSALANHSSMPDSYWHERHKLQRQAQAINAIVEILREMGE